MTSVSSWMRGASLPLLTLMAIFVAWEICVRILSVPAFLLPAPSGIVMHIASSYMRLAYHLGVTLTVVLLGYFVSVLLGIGVATALAHSDFLNRAVLPLLVISQVVPQVAIAPILVIWFGPGLLAKTLIVFIICFFPMVVNTTAGLLRVDQDLLYLARGLNASRAQIFFKILLPNALPNIFAGMKISITLAVIGGVVAEFIAGSSGLGYLVFTGSTMLDTTLVFSSVFILAALGISLFWTIQSLQRLLLPWFNEAELG